MPDDKVNMNIDGVQKYFKIIITSIIIGTLAVVSVFLLSAFLLSQFNIPASLVPLISTLAGIIGSFTASFVAAKILRKNGMLIGLFCGLMICIFIFIAGMAFFELSLGMIVFTKFIAIIIAAIIGGIFGVNRKKNKR